MTTQMSVDNRLTSSSPRYLFLVAAVMTYLLIAMGGMVCITGSGRGCPDWPACYGQIVPPMRLDAIIEYTHRFIAALTSPFLVAAAIVGWRFRSIRWLSRPPILAVGFLAAVILFGALAILRGIPPGIAALDLGSALIVLALIVTATVIAFVRHGNPALPDRLSFHSSFARLVLGTLVAVFVVLVSGKVVAESGSIGRCLGWPLWSEPLASVGLRAGAQRVYLLVAAVASILAVATVVQAWRTQRTRTAILSAATVMGILFLAQGVAGVLMAARSPSAFLMVLRVATVAAVWAALVVLVVLAGLASSAPAGERLDTVPSSGSGRHVRDLLMMTRPIVVALLLVTAYVGMVVARQALPPLTLTFWTLLGLAMATGGAQAVNQYLDRDLDRLMERTAGRPLPAGRLVPAEGLAWGLALCVASFYVVAEFVNGLAALLTLIGILYYVLLYTVVLKRKSVRSTVVGGGAGALLPIVGWAAATGRLEATALLLFAIVFCWTPPHFWALALLRVVDYTRANLPVLPVVHGEKLTRTRIMLYTLGLIVVTMFLPLLRVAGSVYLAVALLLGCMLLYAAWEVWKHNSARAVRNLYRASSMYLALLFLALVADVLIRRV